MMKIEEINQGEDSDFIAVADKVYQHDDNWVKPFDAEIKATFDPEQNAFFKAGKARRWVLESSGGCVGRVAAFINYNKNEHKEVPTGGIGFFECSPCKEAAFELLDQ